MKFESTYLGAAIIMGFVVGCGDGAEFPNSASTLVSVTEEPAGDNCKAGGYAMHSGVDADGDGTLSTEEQEQTQFVCNGGDGADGENGKSGKNGVDAKDGKDGTNGVDGLNGKDGIDGLNGTNGIDGINGTNGIDGINGTNGIDGINGVDGKDGVDGLNGIDGKDGKDGVDGINGVDGKDGVDGLNGTDGVNGIDGKDGKDGKDGVDGINGKDGKDGVDGVNGVDGINGIDGKDGVDGINGGSSGALHVFDANDADLGRVLSFNGNLYMLSNEGYFYIFQPYDMKYASQDFYYTAPDCQGDPYSQGWWGNSNFGKTAIYHPSSGWFVSVTETQQTITIQSRLATNGTCYNGSYGTTSAFQVIPSTAAEVGVPVAPVGPLSIQ